VYLNNLNIGETYQLRARVVSSDDTSRVWAYETVDFEATAREMTVEVHFTIDTSEICAGSNEAHIVCFEQLWQLDTQNTGRGEVLLAKHEDVRDQDQTIILPPEIGTTVLDDTTNSQYSMIGDSVTFTDYVEYHRLHIGETYTVNGVLMDHQTGLPVLDRNGQQITGSTTFVATETDGIVEVHFTFDSLYLVEQIGQTINGVTIEAPRELVVFESIRSSSGFDFEIHADIDDDLQTLTLGDIRSGAGDTQTSTSWLAAGLTTVHDNVHYRGLGPVEYTLRGSLHLVDYDENGNPIDGGLIQARPGEVVELEHTWTPSNHEGDVGFDFKLDSDRFQGRNIVVFEELWYNGICIISHENYSDSMGNYGMANTEQTVHVASCWTSAFSFQSGEQLLAYTTDATVTDFVYCGNLDVGQRYYCEASLWACYTDENGYIHNVPLTQEEGGIACSPVFTAEENHAIAEVTFHIDATKYFDEGYDYLLVSERLIHAGSGVCIATHSDLTSKEQSINIPDLHTTFTCGECGHTLPESAMSDVVPVTVTDRVYYENLVCDGRSYTVVGNIQYARTDANGNIIESGPLMRNGQPVTSSVTFVPTETSGYVDVEFEVYVADIVAHDYNRIVAFEDLYFGPEGIRVGIHADINDSDQTIDVPGTPTPTPPGTPPDVPKTGDDSAYGSYVVGAIVAVTFLASGITLLVILDRRKKY
ncbi:MAG: VaFE repeat-containing surface-anchored protein, partial [Mogibacterium sp.]|nr:VaFE repeat-containing surface-anchored protein [Mogibacterium sp.]